MSTKTKSDKTEDFDRNFFGPLFKKGTFVQEISQQFGLFLRLIKDDRVPTLLKLIPIFSIVYVLFPFDLIPDLFPVAGQVDDIGVMAIGLKLFLDLAPAGIVREHLNAMADIAEEVDGKWKVVDNGRQED